METSRIMEGKDGVLLLESNNTDYESSSDPLYIQKLKVFGSEEASYWKRFSILPNVNGQKYTLGNKFTSREEQGEFIFMSETTVGRSLGALGMPFQWEITVEDGKYFVTPIITDSNVNHNRFKIQSKTRLEFGDTLTLVDNGTTFLFNEREFQPEFVQDGAVQTVPQCYHSITGEFSPGENSLILSRILSFLPIKELKIARFVSKFWNEEGFRILSERCILRFGLGFTHIELMETTQLFRHSVEMWNRPMKDWMICIFELGPKIREDLNYFVLDAQPPINYVKRLHLGVNISSEEDYKLQIKLLHYFAKGLKELTWSGSWHLDTATGEDYPFPENIGLSKLQVFNLSLSPTERWGSHPAINCSSLTWLKKLVKSIKGVSTIRLNCPGSLSFTFLNIFQDTENWKLFSNLNDLSLGGINPNVIQSLLKLKLDKPLKKLGLLGWENINNSDLPAIDQLLLKYSSSLESLEFSIVSTHKTDEDVFINFPAFPKIELLSIGFPNEGGRGWEKLKKLKFLDGAPNVNYKNLLPRLKYLRLWPKQDSSTLGFGGGTDLDRYLTDSAPLHEMFFPGIVESYDGEIEICSSLQRLEVPSLMVSYKNDCLVYGFLYFDLSEKPRFSEEAASVIATMFPNVVNEWINSARKPKCTGIRS